MNIVHTREKRVEAKHIESGKDIDLSVLFIYVALWASLLKTSYHHPKCFAETKPDFVLKCYFRATGLTTCPLNSLLNHVLGIAAPDQNMVWD